MQIISHEITKKDYERYKNDKATLKAEREKNLPDSWTMGYGYYGCYVKEESGEYFVCYKLGSSCD